MNTLFFGHAHKHYDSLESTNETLRALSQDKSLPEGFVVSSKHQTSGRGQYGNRWEDEAGKNLLLSLYLRPKFLSVTQNFRLSMSVCLGLHAFAERFVESAQIKWPNDLLIEGRKCAGILIENQLAGRGLDSSIVGIGFNVNQRSFKEDHATSLARLTEKQYDLEELQSWLLADLEHSYLQLQRAPQVLTDRYLSVLHGFGETVLIALPNGKDDSLRITHVADDGALEGILGSSGKKARFYFKELRFIY